MATVSTKIICAGQHLKAHRLKIEQPHNWHHTFEIAVSSETVEGKNAINIDNSVKFLGEMIEVNMQAKMKVEGDGSTFKGIVTSVNIDRSYTNDSLIVLSGYSPTYLLEDGEGCQSFEGMTGQSIFNKVMSNYPINQLYPVADANNTTKMPFVVRYKETNYQFLNRLAALNGEWFYYNGLETRFGKHPHDDTLDIKFGKDLTSFEYGVTMKPTLPDYAFYNYQHNHQFVKKTMALNPDNVNGYTKKALQLSNRIFSGGHRFPVRANVIEETVLNQYADIQKAATLSNSTCFNGSSTNPSLVVGGSIKVNANTIVNGQNKTVFVNRFRLIQVNHQIDATGNYTNTFEAIPITVAAPPVNPNVKMPEAESQVAVTRDNNDPEGLGRIRVQFKWQSGNEMTPWVRVLTSSAAGGRGMYFIPEIEDEVYVDFDQGNPDRPYVMGSLFHGKAKPTWGSAGNDTKALRTRSGSRVELNDADGSVNIIDPSGNTVTMAGNGEITISAPNMITLSSTDIIIDANNDLTLKAGNNIMVEAGNDITVDTGNNFTKTAANNISSKAGNNIKAVAASDMKVEGTKTEIKGKTSVKVSGTKAEVEGKTSAKISGLQTEVTGIATLKLQALGLTTIKGLPVKIN